MRAYLPLFIITIGFALLSNLNSLAGADASGFFDDSFGDLQEELAIARQEGKQGVMLFFETEDCPFCHRMKRDVFSRPEVQKYFHQHFRLIPIDIEGDVEITDFQGQPTTMKAFAAKHRVRATPVMAFFDLDGKRVATYIGATRDAREFLLLGEFVADGHYKTTNFVKFKRARRRAQRG